MTDGPKTQARTQPPLRVGTSFSDRELTAWADIERADAAHAYDWGRHGVSAPVAAVAMAGELLALRNVARRLLLLGNSDDLIAEAARVLGFNERPDQR